MALDLPDRPLPRRSGHLPSQPRAAGPPPAPRTAGHQPGHRPQSPSRLTPDRPALTGRPVPPPDTVHHSGDASPRRGSARVGIWAAVAVVCCAAVVVLSTGATSTPPSGLDAELQARFQEAVADAAQDGVTLSLTSGWRSPEEQQRLVDDAVDRHGSIQEARRWVLPPEASAHVAGLAIDVGPAAGALWLDERSERYGLCRTYANEGWHFEPIIERGGTCPAMLEDSSAGWPGRS